MLIHLDLTVAMKKCQVQCAVTTMAKFGSQRLPNRFLGPAELKGLEINRMWSVGRYNFLHLANLAVQWDVLSPVVARTKSGQQAE